jgi:hypothetical protein
MARGEKKKILERFRRNDPAAPTLPELRGKITDYASKYPGHEVYFDGDEFAIVAEKSSRGSSNYKGR